jgi:hypothetical protein
LAFAQQSNPGANAARGVGTQQNSLRTGGAASSQRGLRNQRTGRGIYNYYRGGRRCYRINRLGVSVRICGNRP